MIRMSASATLSNEPRRRSYSGLAGLRTPCGNAQSLDGFFRQAFEIDRNAVYPERSRNRWSKLKCSNKWQINLVK